VTCDFPRVDDYSELFTDDLVDILGLSVTSKESVSRVMLTGTALRFRNWFGLQESYVGQHISSGPYSHHLMPLATNSTSELDLLFHGKDCFDDNSEIIHVCKVCLC